MKTFIGPIVFLALLIFGYLRGDRRGPLYLVAIGGILALYAYLGYRTTEREARKGWDLVPVIVTGADLDAGTVLTTDMIAQRPIPSQFLTPNIVKPEGYTSIIGKKLLIDVRKGDPLLWTEVQR